MDEPLNDMLSRMTVRNLERMQSGCERDGDYELADIVAARLGTVAGSARAAEPSPPS